MKTPLSPNDIEVLLWYHTREAEHTRIEAPAVQGALTMFQQSGMLRRTPTGGHVSIYHTTEKGQAMVAALCRTPEPRQVWVDGRTGEELT